MSFQTPITINEAIENVSSGRYLLPAIQREFEWSSDKIEWLFDSLMRGYPISSFLFWNVEGASVSGYRFYSFLREYRERYKIHNENANVEGLGNFTAVLDGQQRLTSLYIGLKGSYAYKEPRKHWNDDEWSIPTRSLYLNILKKLDENEEEDGRVYEFSFLKNTDTGQKDLYKSEWFRVGKILDLRNVATFNKYVRDNDFDDLGSEILARLQEVIYSERQINYFLEKEQDLHKALNIFIRINSGGEPLNFSDLIMSIAIASWERKDARKEIHGVVDRIQGVGFSISKDFVFKTYLYLFSTDIRFKVTNFTTENAHNFEKNWESIRDAIEKTFDLVQSFGFNDHTLTSKNAVIPIIYYLYHRGIYQDFKTRVQFQEDRDRIRQWLHVMTLKRIFGGQSDGTLSQIRKAFTDDVSSNEPIRTGVDGFPDEGINKAIRRDTSVGEEFLDELLKTQKDDRYAFSILALLNPQLDYRNNDFHKDHLHPISSFNLSAIDALSLTDEQREVFLSSEHHNSIINLQMLDSNENMSKQDKSLNDWVTTETERKDLESFLDRCAIPLDVSLAFKDFAEFAIKRKALLASKLHSLLT